jgi:hypothetical protein
MNSIIPYSSSFYNMRMLTPEHVQFMGAIAPVTYLSLTTESASLLTSLCMSLENGKLLGITKSKTSLFLFFLLNFYSRFTTVFNQYVLDFSSSMFLDYHKCIIKGIPSETNTFLFKSTSNKWLDYIIEVYNDNDYDLICVDYPVNEEELTILIPKIWKKIKSNGLLCLQQFPDYMQCINTILNTINIENKHHVSYTIHIIGSSHFMIKKCCVLL